MVNDSKENSLAREWVNSRIWSSGLKIHLFNDVNALEFKRQFEHNMPTWKGAFRFLSEGSALAIMPAGEYPLPGLDAYAIITEGPSKEFEATRWESHQKYIDVQYVISGKETIGVVPRAAAILTEPYNDAKDVAFYVADGSYYSATPEIFFLFFPEDVHRPNIKSEGADQVKKLVIKIRNIQ